MQNNNPISQLIKILNALPGIGGRSARRIALHLITNNNTGLLQLSHSLKNIHENIKKCEICNNIDTISPCTICSSEKRDKKTICVIADVMDLWAIERSSSYKGLYHILGGILSAIDGIGPDDLSIDRLVNRIKSEEVTEVILALSATVDGQSTAHYITDKLSEFKELKITRLAHGMPIGGELDYLDDGTIITAFKSRSSI